MPFCKTCDKHMFTFEVNNKSHKCPPVFQVWEDNYLEGRRPPDKPDASDWANSTDIRATYHESAAEKAAEQSDQYGDYAIVSGDIATMYVRDQAGVVKVFIVSGESVPEYSAREIDQPEETPANGNDSGDSDRPELPVDSASHSDV